MLFDSRYLQLYLNSGILLDCLPGKFVFLRCGAFLSCKGDLGTVRGTTAGLMSCSEGLSEGRSTWCVTWSGCGRTFPGFSF